MQDSTLRTDSRPLDHHDRLRSAISCISLSMASMLQEQKDKKIR